MKLRIPVIGISDSRAMGSPSAWRIGWVGIFTLSDPVGPEYAPLDTYNGGGFLKPGESGVIGVFDDHHMQDFTGSISWQADACIESALVVTVRSTYSKNDRMTDSRIFLNGGNAF